METSQGGTGVIRFGTFEVDPSSGELRKRGIRIRLPEQSFKILLMLLMHPGALVTREELRRKLWPDGTFVDFDHGLNAAINRLRVALDDSAGNPRFVETLAHRGYRFIGSAEGPSKGFPGTRLAVLPFDNLSGDVGQEYFSDGMTEELITQLGRLEPRRLAVIARPSAMRYKGTNKRIDEIGGELSVDFILAGSVRRTGERVRITAQLVQVRDQTQLWAESYDRTLSDILDLQSEVAKAIAREIKFALSPGAQARLTTHREVDPEAYEAYLKGRHYWNKRTEEGLKKAAEYFRQAIEKNPRYALAYSGLADSYTLLGDAGYGCLPPREAARGAKPAAIKALEIDDTLAEAHTSLGSVKEQFEWDWEGAEREYKRALELHPGSAIAHHWYAYLLAQTGRLEEAAAEIGSARELDPLSLIINTDLGWVHYLARRYGQAIEQLLKTLELDSSFIRAHYLLGRSYLEKAMYRESIGNLQRAADLSGRNPVYVAGLGCAYAASGKRDEAAHILNELKETSERRYVPCYDIAIVHVTLGQKDDALVWLEKAFEEGSDFKDELGAGPALDPLRSDPRFQDLLRRVGLPQ
jgi:TolB-like protein/DNA-binding winged helix-turn-helix (wHTH) protein/Flp pilus assembly protein TadD